ncbi:MAG: FRG domain-containing protein [Oscillibacter sp.]|nr:FRG domain-containing protein [Oscillibacter sp.]
MLYPNGWLIRMKQYLRRPFTQYEIYEKQFKHLQNGTALYISYGNFDRIEFVPITEFSSYRSCSAEDNLWYGKWQSIILYAINENHRLFQVNSVCETEAQKLMEGRPGDTPHPVQGRFIIYTMLHISGAAKSTVRDYRRFLELIQEKIHHVVDLYCEKRECQNEHLACEVFGTFNAAEVAVWWTADQFTDVLFLLDELRHLRFKLPGTSESKKIFVSTYTVIAANSDSSSVSAPKGTAMVQLECSAHGGSFQNTTDFINGAIQNAIAAAPFAEGAQEPDWRLYSCAGEYDYIAEMPFSLLPSLFPSQKVGKEANFSMHNPEFARHIRQTTTRLSYQDSDIDHSCKELDWENILCIELESGDTPDQNYDTSHVIAADYIEYGKGLSYRLYAEICSNLEKLVPYSGMWKTLKLLYSDYAEILCTAVDHLWVKDFNEQFIAALHIIKSLLKWWEQRGILGKSDIDNFTGQFRMLSEILQQQVHHISESSKLFFEVPNSKLGYTAQFDLILHAYYGIVKSLIEHAYKTERVSWQYKLIPVINFTNTSLIRSKMLRTVDDDRNSARLISIEFPYDAWSNPLYYTPFLFHEIYHYVAPTDRKERNTSFMVIVLHRICIEWLNMAAEDFLLRKDGITRDDIDDNKLAARYSQQIEELVRVLRLPVFQVICNRRCSLLETVLPADYVSPDGTAYELRNAVAFWLSSPECHARRMDLIGELIRTAVESVSDPVENAETQAYLDAVSAKELYRISQRRFDRDCRDILYSAAIGTILNLREIYPDFAMINGTSMGLTEYLLQFAMLQTNLLNDPSTMDDWAILSLRLGPIMQHFLPKDDTQEDALEDHLKEFQRMFPVFLHCSGLSSNDGSILDAPCTASGNTAGELAALWAGFFSQVYRYYQANFSIYDHECAFQIKTQYRFSNGPEMEFIRNLYQEYWSLLRGCAQKTDISAQIFQMNLRLIHCYQNQHSLKELSDVNKNHSAVTGSPFRQPALLTSTVYSAHNVSSVLNNCDDLLLLLRKMVWQLNDAHKSVFGEKIDSNGIWYRGISNSKFHILPSLFVNYPKDAEFVNGCLTKTPYQLLMHRFQQFKFRADGAPELYSQPSYQASDYFALMQHYQIQTHMLDWSEDVFASLYFALEKYVQYKDPKEWTDNPDANAAIYLFDPAAYNRVRGLIIKSNLECLQSNNSCWSCRFKACQLFRNYIEQTVDSISEIVPNVSVGLNRDIFDVLFCEKKVDSPFRNLYYSGSAAQSYSPVTDAPLCFSLPIAAYTSRLNPRIRAQSGQFMIFSPYTIPVLCQNDPSKNILDGCFDYVALDMIQKKWLASHPDEKPFLLKMEISRSIKEQLGRQLRILGVKTSNYYPELANERFSISRWL